MSGCLSIIQLPRGAFAFFSIRAPAGRLAECFARKIKMQRPFRPSPSNALLYPGVTAVCYWKTALVLAAASGLGGLTPPQRAAERVQAPLISRKS